MPIVLSPSLQKRSIDNLPPRELAMAAQWWCRNAAIMSESDPSRSHLSTVPMIALLAPNAGTLAAWLEQAHDATKMHGLTIYENCYVELHQATPPWAKGSTFENEHQQRYVIERCAMEMLKILGSVREDMARLPTIGMH